jgi:hypothetical protein
MELEEMKGSQKEAREEEELLQKNLAMAQVKYGEVKLVKLRQYEEEIKNSSRILGK